MSGRRSCGGSAGQRLVAGCLLGVVVAALGMLTGCSSSKRPLTQMAVWSSAGTSSSDLWVVGDERSGSGPLRVAARHWNGATWSASTPVNPVGCRFGAVLNGVASVTDSDVWAVGQCSTSMTRAHPLVEHFDGTAWRVLDLPVGPTLPGFSILRSVSAAAADDVWAVGSSNAASHASIVEHWNGATWSRVPAPDLALTAVSVAGADDVWALAGEQGGAVVHWDGTRWQHETGVPNPSDVEALGPDDVWVVGSASATSSAGTPATTSAAAHWDGRSWTPVRVPSVGSGSQALQAVTSDGADIWVAGNASVDKGTRGFVLHWTGRTFAVALGPSLGSLLRAATALGASDVWAFGPFVVADPNAAPPNSAHWDGRTWSVTSVA